MAYPWPSFGSFVFQRDESALDGIGGTWNYESNEARSLALGAISDNIVLLGISSGKREFQCYLSPDRLISLRSLLYTTGIFTEWRTGKNVLPDSKNCRLDVVEAGDSIAVRCQDGSTQRRIITTVKLTAQ